MEAKEKKPFKVKAVCTSCGKEVPLFQNDRADDSTCTCDKQDCDIEAVKIRVAGDQIEPGPPPLSEKAVEADSGSSLNFKPNLPLAISPATESDYFIKPGYKLVAALGEGSMGSAYKVHSESLNSDFVIKKLNPVLSENPRTAKRWRLSGSEVSHLSHPNMESIYEVDIAPDGSSYMVTEAVEGEPLAKLIQREGFMEPVEVIEIAKQVCEALAYIHENGILHRGLNPRNLFLAKSKGGKYSVKLTDSGTARAWPSSGRETRFLLSDGKEFGDPRYMSPEQCSGQRLTEGADIYSFGCVMYEALGGKPPFSSRNPNQTAVKQLTADIRPLSDRFRDLDIPADLEAIVMKALQKDPLRRYKSGKEMLRDLEKLGTPKVASKLPFKAPTLQTPLWLKAELKEGLDLRKIIILFAITAIVTALGGLIYSVKDHHENQINVPAETTLPIQPTPPVRTFLENESYVHLAKQHRITVSDIYGMEVKTFEVATLNDAINKMILDHDDLQKLDCHGARLEIRSDSPQSFSNSDFSGAHLSRSVLNGSNFKETKFVGGHLSDNRFDRADFANSDAQQATLARNQLIGANLSFGDFSRATMNDNNLSSIQARCANFDHARFTGGLLEKADLSEATFNSANFDYVGATGATFYKANLEGINCTRSHFPHTNFQLATLDGAYLASINFAFANFSNASLKNANLSSAYLCHAIFKNAHLSRANLSNANLSDCDFTNADLSFADLSKADLTHAKFDHTNLTGAKINFDRPTDSKSRAALFRHAIFKRN